MPSKKPNQQGLTLIEVLVSLAILSLAVFSLSVTGFQSIRLAEESFRYSLVSAAGGDLLAMERALLRAHPELVSGTGFAQGAPTGFRDACFSGACAPDELQAHLEASWKCSLGYMGTCTDSAGIHRLAEFDAKLEVDASPRVLRLEMEWLTKGREREMSMSAQIP